MATINVNNYMISGVDLYFAASIAHASLLATKTGKRTVGSPFRTTGRNLGNIVTGELTPNVTYVEHWITKNGERFKDQEEASSKSLTIPFTFDEINEANMKKFLLASTLGGNKLAVLQKPLQVGSASLLFRTQVGTTFVYSIPKCTIKSDGAMAFTGEDWWSVPMQIEALYYSSGQYASKPYGIVDMAP